MAAFRSYYVEANGIRIHYWREGRGFREGYEPREGRGP
jgi:hypothetical protein